MICKNCGTQINQNIKFCQKCGSKLNEIPDSENIQWKNSIKIWFLLCIAANIFGKTVILVANLKPAKLCGEVSMGMICAADLPDDKIKVIFLDDDIAPGTKIR